MLRRALPVDEALPEEARQTAVVVNEPRSMVGHPGSSGIGGSLDGGTPIGPGEHVKRTVAGRMKASRFHEAEFVPAADFRFRKSPRQARGKPMVCVTAPFDFVSGTVGQARRVKFSGSDRSERRNRARYPLDQSTPMRF